MEQNQTSLLQHVSKDTVLDPHQHPPLETVQRPLLGTNAAAFYLNARAQTMRLWASRDKGPIRPVRIGGRLRWRTSDVKRLVGG
jgi:hypothetical protein